jgi:pilus assembly protein CpaE
MAVTDRFKVLIVASTRSVTERFEKLFGFIETVELVGTVGTAQDATALILEVRPDVVLMDISLPDINGIQFTEMIRREHPDVQVIVLAQDKLGDIVLNAMRSGASDFLTHDVPLEELRVSTYRAGEIALAEKKKRGAGPDAERKPPSVDKDGVHKGKVIAVYGPKGGSGTTTLAINLAIALQNSETTVGLVDADMQYGDVGLLLNEMTTLSILDLVTRIYELDTHVIEDVMVLHKSSGMHFLTAPPRPELAEKVEGEHFTIILGLMRQIFDYIVINTNVFISEPCLASLEEADQVVLIATQDIASIRNIHAFLNIWSNLGKTKDRLTLVLNRYIKKRNITPEKIGERLGMPVAVTISEDDIVFRSLNLGIPFMLTDKDTPTAQAVQELANKLHRELGK